MKKKRSHPEEDDLRPEYDLSTMRLIGVGPGRKLSAKTRKLIQENRRALGFGVVVLDADVAEKFPSSRDVNETLRAVGELIKLRKKHAARKSA
jgi:hypothetical protein